MAGAWINCCCESGLRQVAAQVSHTTFVWQSALPEEPPYALQYGRGRVTEVINELGGASCISDFAFFGILNRVIVKRVYTPSFEDFQAAKTAWGGGPLSDESGPNHYLQTWGSKTLFIEGVNVVQGAQYDMELWSAIASAVNWNSIPNNGSMILESGIFLPPGGYIGVTDFTGPSLLAVLNQRIFGVLATAITAGPTSILELRCPVPAVSDRPLDLLFVGLTISNFPPVQSPPRMVGRYQGTISATKVGSTHTEVAYAWTPPFTNFPGTPFENNPWHVDCALTRTLFEGSRQCNQPPRIVLPPALPGTVLIPNNPAAFPC